MLTVARGGRMGASQQGLGCTWTWRGGSVYVPPGGIPWGSATAAARAPRPPSPHPQNQPRAHVLYL